MVTLTKEEVMKKETKIFEAEVKDPNEADLTVTHFISTERRDRGGDVLLAKGMKITGRPVVLLQHGWGAVGPEPIAKPVWIKKGEFKNNKGVQAKTQFYPDELGKRLWSKCAQGYIPNWSIGWIPLKEEFVTEDDGGRTRVVSEWELLEYSLVGVPMQPDAQNVDKTGNLLFKVLDGCTEVEEKLGALFLKTEDGRIVDLEDKPFPNEHACRLEDPDKYIRFRRENDKFKKGIHAIWGVQGGDKPVELQALRFDKEKFTASDARAWLKEHEYKCTLFEPASEKCGTCGEMMGIIWDQDVSGEKCIMTCEAGFVHRCNKCSGIKISTKDIGVKSGCVTIGVHSIATFIDIVDPGADPKLQEVLKFAQSFVDEGIPVTLLADDGSTFKLKPKEDLEPEIKELVDALTARLCEVEKDLVNLRAAFTELEVREATVEHAPELVVVDDDDGGQAARDAVKNTVAEVMGELLKEEEDRLRGKIK
jgi:hypothetical protein